MGITRDPEYPVEMAQLAAAFNRCADGYDAKTVLNASVQMVTASIGFMAKQGGASIEDALKFAAHVGEMIAEGVKVNWDRVPTSTDISVDAS